MPRQVRVIGAAFNTQDNIYTAVTADTPPRNLVWTPAVSPGESSTALPREQNEPSIYEGATITPVDIKIEGFPGVLDASFDDYIIVFPADSGLPPIYTMFRDRREEPGAVDGIGKVESDIWLADASQGGGAPIPSRIADQLRGREFSNWNSFRQAFWITVATDTLLVTQFNPGNIGRMKKSYAPVVSETHRVGTRDRFELHHVQPISQGGDVYNVDNLAVTTPKLHIEIHRNKKQ